MAKYVNQLIFDAGIRTDLLSSSGAQRITYRPGNVVTTSTEDKSIQIKLDGSRSLADFKGFVGDGIADDSDAYERAILWQISKTVYWKPTLNGGDASTVLICPGLTIPKGARVKLTRTMPSAIYLVADGFASIEAGPTVDMILGNASYRAHYENIFFVGGQNQIHLNNKNVNFGLWMFRNCTFSSSNAIAVQLRNTATDYGVTSTQAIFDNCRWSRCRQALFTECDHTFVTGGWLQPYGDNMDTDTAVIKHVGLFTMTDMMLIPSGTFAAKCRWIDSYGGVRLTRVRFGGENGGLPAIYWFAPPPKFVVGTDESIEVGIILDGCNSYFGALIRPDAGGVVLKGNLPRIIRFCNCTGPIGGRLIHNDPADGGIPDIPAYIAYHKGQWAIDDMYPNFSFHFTGNGIKVGQNLWPSDLDTYSYTDKGRFVEPRAYLADPGTTVLSGTTTRMSFDTQTIDPYKYATVSTGATVIRAPARSTFVRLSCNIVGPTSTANGLRYTAQVYYDNAPTGIVAYYDHDKDGPPRFNLTGGLPVVPTKDLDVRITQASGASISFTGTITVDFDVKQW
ncbi:hypothetical protein D3C72_946450 [compost metagenome]